MALARSDHAKRRISDNEWTLSGAFNPEWRGHAGLNREIVDRAIELLGDSGENALSMRRVADACGVTPMAIYHHVDNKDELLTLAVDRVIAGTLADDDPAEPWRTRLIEFGCRFRGALVDHPGIGAVFVSRPILAPTSPARPSWCSRRSPRAASPGRQPPRRPTRGCSPRSARSPTTCHDRPTCDSVEVEQGHWACVQALAPATMPRRPTSWPSCNAIYATLVTDLSEDAPEHEAAPELINELWDDES